jgi:hypothetical protein
MNSPIPIILAGLMFTTSLLLRRYENVYSASLSVTAIVAMWFCLAWRLRMKWGEAGMEQWKVLRQRGRLYFSVVHGGFFLLFLLAFLPSINFAEGHDMEIERFWWRLAIGICAGPLSHLWVWQGNERKFLEWQRKGPLPFHGVV